MTSHRWSALGDVYVAPPPAPSPRSFGLTVGLVLCAIAVFSGWRGHLLRAGLSGAAGVALVAAALIRPSSLTRLAAVWSRVGHALGWVNSRVLLTVMFLIVVWPIGAVSRLFGSDPLDTRRRNGSFWLAYSSRLRDRKHFERLF
jgi:Saxitoxin biosynthesis operon protein SxtJ